MSCPTWRDSFRTRDVGAGRAFGARAGGREEAVLEGRAGAGEASAELVERVERLLLERVLADLDGRAARGRAVAGFVKVEQMIGRGQAGLLVVADEADGDGLHKLQATGLPLEKLGDAVALGGIFGREQAVYVAIAPR